MPGPPRLDLQLDEPEKNAGELLQLSNAKLKELGSKVNAIPSLDVMQLG